MRECYSQEEADRLRLDAEEYGDCAHCNRVFSYAELRRSIDGLLCPQCLVIAEAPDDCAQCLMEVAA